MILTVGCYRLRMNASTRSHCAKCGKRLCWSKRPDERYMWFCDCVRWSGQGICPNQWVK